MATMIGCLSTQALAFLAVFVYVTHATQAIAFEWKPGFKDYSWRDGNRSCVYEFTVRTPCPSLPWHNGAVIEGLVFQATV